LICVRKYLRQENEALAIFDETRKPKPKVAEQPSSGTSLLEQEKLNESFSKVVTIEMSEISSEKKEQWVVK
jgi:hypothetical protein